MDTNSDVAFFKTGEGNPQKIKILMYHYVSEDDYLCRKFPELMVHVDSFKEQLEILDRLGFTPITFRDYSLFKQGEINLPKRPIIITFDDGHEGIYQLAYPILREFGMKAVVFCIADKNIKTNIWDKSKNLPQFPLLKDNQIIELHRGGLEIGSHSLSHKNLCLTDDAQAWEEISRSRILLEILLNSDIKSFAYPYGETNDNIKRMVSNAGYDTGCGTYSGPKSFGKDEFEFRRILINGNSSVYSFIFKIFTPYQYYGWFRWKIKTFLEKYIFSR